MSSFFPEGKLYVTCNLSFPTLLGIDDAVSAEYGVSNVPVTFFMDKDGIIQLGRASPFSSITDIESNLVYTMP